MFTFTSCLFRWVYCETPLSLENYAMAPFYASTFLCLIPSVLRLGSRSSGVSFVTDLTNLSIICRYYRRQHCLNCLKDVLSWIQRAWLEVVVILLPLLFLPRSLLIQFGAIISVFCINY